MKTKSLQLVRACLACLILVICLPLQAQEKKGTPSGSEFCYYIANEVRSGSQLEFDLLLVNLNPSITFELGTVQAGILVNPAICNGGTLKASVVPGSSQLNTSQAPASIQFQQNKHVIKLASRTPPGLGSGTVISADPKYPTRICRIRLNNSTSFTNGPADLHFCFTTKPYPTKISRYDSGNGMNVMLTIPNTNCAAAFQGITREISDKGNAGTAQDRLQVYPNPNNGTFNLTINTTAAETFELRITNDLGAVVYRKADLYVDGTQTEAINLDGIADGSYTITLVSKQEQLSRKFVVKK